MNETLQLYAREQMLEGLKQLPNEWQMTFKKMYSHKDLEKPIEAIVNDMPSDKLDWALSQIERSLAKLANS